MLASGKSEKTVTVENNTSENIKLQFFAVSGAKVVTHRMAERKMQPHTRVAL